MRFSRLNIYARDDNTCQYCAQKLPRTMLNLDHVIPRAQGGRTTWENVVCCCVPCNLKKGAKLAGRGRDEAAQEARAPDAGPRPSARPAAGSRYREWLPFLGVVDASYWNTELIDED